MSESKNTVYYNPKESDEAPNKPFPLGSFWYCEKTDTVYILTRMFYGSREVWGTVSLTDGTLWLCSQLGRIGGDVPEAEINRLVREVQDSVVHGLVRIEAGAELNIVVG